MKKLLLMFLFFCMSIDVHALSYTDYSDYEPYIDMEIKCNDLTDVKVQRRYKYYKYNQIYGPYESVASSEYPFIDKDDYIYSDYSDWSEIVPEDKESLDVRTKQVYKYLKAQDINEVYFKGDGAEIENIVILDDGKEISYEIVSGDFDLINTEGLKIKLNRNVDFDKFRSIVYSGFNNGERSKLKVNYMSDSINCLNLSLIIEPNASVTTIGYLFDASNLVDYYTSQKLTISKNTKYIDEVTLYSYRDKLYHLYNLEKEYFSDYLTEPYGEYIYKDENEYKDFYAKRTRGIIDDNALIPISDTFKDKINFTNLNSFTGFDNGNSLKDSLRVKEHAIFKPVKATKVKEKDDNVLFIFVLFGIIILLLSKCYKIKRKRARVKKVMLC